MLMGVITPVPANKQTSPHKREPKHLAAWDQSFTYNIHQIQPQQANQAGSELGRFQPQLVFYFSGIQYYNNWKCVMSTLTMIPDNT